MKAFLLLILCYLVDSIFAQKIDTLELHYIKPRTKYTISEIEPLYKKIKKHKYVVVDSIYWLGYYKDPIVIAGKDTSHSLLDFYDEVSKDEYINFLNDKRIEDSLNSITCTNCWQRVFNKDNILIYEGLFNQDCTIGELRDYYLTGSIKQISHYRPTLKEEKINGKCCMKIGEWIYFKPDGAKEKIEKYKNDVLVETISF